MIQHAWRHLLPHWPVVPARLWLTAGGVALAALSLAFAPELWPNSPRAGFWTWVVLTVLLLAGGLQAVGVLLRWPTTYAGPRWMRFALGCVGLALGIGVAVLTLLVSLLSGLRVAFLGAG